MTDAAPPIALVAPPIALAATLAREIAWLEAAIADRLQQSFATTDRVPAPKPPELRDRCAYGAAIVPNRLTVQERLVLILALAPWVRPQALDPLCVRNAGLDRPFTEFGGLHPDAGRPFIPTRQTALFLIAGDDIAERLAAMPIFGMEGALVRNRLIAAHPDALAPWLGLEPHPELLARLFRHPG